MYVTHASSLSCLAVCLVMCSVLNVCTCCTHHSFNNLKKWMLDCFFNCYFIDKLCFHPFPHLMYVVYIGSICGSKCWKKWLFLYNDMFTMQQYNDMFTMQQLETVKNVHKWRFKTCTVRFKAHSNAHTQTPHHTTTHARAQTQTPNQNGGVYTNQHTWMLSLVPLLTITDWPDVFNPQGLGPVF